MKKINSILVVLVAFIGFMFFSVTRVEAKEVVASASSENILGDVLGTIRIYDDGEIKFEYKYGLRRADLYYCIKGEECDNENYQWIKIMEASADNPYKNEGYGLASYSYEADLDKSNEYRLVVEAYFGISNSYTGSEAIEGSFVISDKQIADTKDTYIKISSGYKNEKISDMMGKIELIVNKVVLPTLYTLISMLFVIKGAVLGFQIVKSADNPDIRREKLGALKWLVIGVFIAYAASTVVGAITGFFESFF